MAVDLSFICVIIIMINHLMKHPFTGSPNELHVIKEVVKNRERAAETLWWSCPGTQVTERFKCN